MASLTAGPNCLAIVLAVNLRISSPATMPLTPPPLRSAVILPNLKTCRTGSGMRRLANNSPTRNNKWVSLLLTVQ